MNCFDKSWNNVLQYKSHTVTHTVLDVKAFQSHSRNRTINLKEKTRGSRTGAVGLASLDQQIRWLMTFKHSYCQMGYTTIYVTDPFSRLGGVVSSSRGKHISGPGSSLSSGQLKTIKKGYHSVIY